MNDLLKILLASTFLICAQPAPARADDAYRKCLDASDGSNPSWSICGSEWLVREDTKLNVAWKRLLAANEPNSVRDLRAEQRAWNAYKDRACRFYSNGDFGREGQVLHYPACRARIISERTMTLNSYAAERR